MFESTAEDINGTSLGNNDNVAKPVENRSKFGTILLAGFKPRKQSGNSNNNLKNNKEQRQSFFVTNAHGTYEYTGELDQNGKPTDRGELKYPNGCVYDGEFNDGKRNGFGKLVFKDGGFAFGSWEHDKPQPSWEWKILYPNKDQYFGTILVDKKPREDLEMKCFLRNGNGEFHYVLQKVKYFGGWLNDKREGYGVCLFGKSGEKYYGEWKDDLFNGFGTLVYRDGTVYQGMFSNGMKNKKGTLYFANGDVIDGSWKMDKIEGATFSKGNGRISL